MREILYPTTTNHPPQVKHFRPKSCNRCVARVQLNRCLARVQFHCRVARVQLHRCEPRLQFHRCVARVQLHHCVAQVQLHRHIRLCVPEPAYWKLICWPLAKLVWWISPQ